MSINRRWQSFRLEEFDISHSYSLFTFQTEIEKLRRNVEKQRRRRGAWEREVGDQVDTLTQENMRLAGEVRRRTEQERRMQARRIAVKVYSPLLSLFCNHEILYCSLSRLVHLVNESKLNILYFLNQTICETFILY